MSNEDDDDGPVFTQETTEEKLMRARCKLITLEPWYGTMASMFRWKCDDRIKTMGVRMVDGGIVECLFNRHFADDLTLKEATGVVKHEIEHVVRLHCVRGGGYSRNHKLFNEACDMTVNGKKSKPNIADLPMIPTFDEEGNKILGETRPCIYRPEDYPDNLTAEELYEKLDKEKKCGTCGGTGVAGGANKGTKPGKGNSPGTGGMGGSTPGKKGQQPGAGGSGKGQQQPGSGGGSGTQHGKNGPPCPKCAGTGHPQGEGEVLDDHDIWDGSTVSEDEARQVVKDMVHQAGIKAGTQPGHLVDAIRSLQDPVVLWKYEFRQYIGREIGSKRPTWSRMNRRRPEFGIKGHSHHASITLTVATDTSGSVTDKMLEQFFSELEAMSMKFKITLMQFDHGYQCHARYHRGDWRKIEIKGRGGTSFIEAFKAMEEKKIVGRLNIICTDGEAPWPEEPKYPVLWVIFRHSKHEVKPPFGRVIYLDK